MNHSKLPARKATLAEVQEQFETWRKNRGQETWGQVLKLEFW